jgi:hypothetical protein
VPPSDVSGFVADEDINSVLLSWVAATDDAGISGYKLTLLTQPFEQSRILTAGTLSFRWTNLSSDTTYTFSIIAFDTSNNASVNPATLSVTTMGPDLEAPADVRNLTGVGGYHDPITRDYVEITLSWTASLSPDLSHYLLTILNDEGIAILQSFNVGTRTAITVPDDSGGPVESSDLVAPLVIGEVYTIRVVAVDENNNISSPGATTTVTPTESVDTDPPEPVVNLTLEPRSGAVDVSWEENPINPGDAAFYRVYFRTPPVDGTAWTLAGETNGFLTLSVTGLTNGTVYEFMVAAVDHAGNETPGAATGANFDDVATKGEAIPTSDQITCIPNVRGGVFRQDYFTSALGRTRSIVVLVATANPLILTSSDTTEFFYTLDGTAISTTSFVVNATHGRFTFNPATNPNVTEVTPGFLYAVEIDFDPSTAGVIEYISENSLRPGGVGADHIKFRYMVKTATDASRVFSETYLVYPLDPGATDPNVFFKFSGMIDERSAPTATYIEGGDTPGDVIFTGGYFDGFALDSAERYRIRFEHFERLLIPDGTRQLAMNQVRGDHAATLLRSSTTSPAGSTVLLTGGRDPLRVFTPTDVDNETLGLKSFEVFSAESPRDGFVSAGSLPAGGRMGASRRLHTATRLRDGSVVAIGGLNGETNIEGSVAMPAQAINAEPSVDLIEYLPPGLFNPAAVVGQVAEMLFGGIVIDTAVVTNAVFDEEDLDYDIGVDGFLIEVVGGFTTFRIINSGTESAEQYDVNGAPAGPTAGNMFAPRYGHSATLLQDGTVFVAGGIFDYRADQNAGGFDRDFEFKCELYHPVTRNFTLLSTLAHLSTTRFFHNAILLRDGKVLLTGGLQKGDHAFKSRGFFGGVINSSSDLYDPFTRSSRRVGSMRKARFGHASALLPSGKVLIAGGYFRVTPGGIPVFDNSAEIYDPDTQTFSLTNSMLTQRALCAAVLIEDQTSPIFGKVLVGGGSLNTLAEIYDEVTGIFQPTAHGLHFDRFVGATSTVLKDGTTLISGGQAEEFLSANNLPTSGDFLATAEIYDTSKVQFSKTQGNLSVARRHHTSTLLQDGTVLIAGGENRNGGVSAAEVYDPAAGTFTSVAAMLRERYKHTATLMNDGRVFVAGGANLSGSLRSCEIYNTTTEAFSSAPSMRIGRFDHTANLLPNGWVLLTGGESIDDDSVEIYDPSADQFLTSVPAGLSLEFGRDGHSLIQPQYAIGRARFTNSSNKVFGSVASPFAYEDTSWLSSSKVRRGDMIVNLSDNVPYVISSIDADGELTLTASYTGASTVDTLTGGQSPVGFEDYVIISQDGYVLGGEVRDTSTEVFRFDRGGVWPGSNPTDFGFEFAPSPINAGRYGHTLVPLADLNLLVGGGEFLLSGEVSTLGATPTDFAGITWELRNLDSLDSWAFHSAYRVQNKMVILVSGHAAQAFFAE